MGGLCLGLNEGGFVWGDRLLSWAYGLWIKSCKQAK
jgi:hypothetical protein